MPIVHDNYAEMAKEELIRRIEAYVESLHDMADRCMAAEGKLQMIERNILMMDGVKS